MLLKSNVSVVITIMLFFTSCKEEREKEPKQELAQEVKLDNSKEGIKKQIAALEDSLFKSEVIDKTKGNRAIELYQRFHKYYWQDTLSADFLFKAAEIADNMGYPQKAIELYKDCYDYYPEHSLAPLCLYQVGNIYNFKLHDFTNAKEAYNDVHKFYPKSTFAKDALAAMRTLTLSDEAMIKEFEKKNKINKE